MANPDATPSLSAAQRSSVDALLDELFDLPESARGAALSARRDTEPCVRAEVASLLRASQAAGSFLSVPPKPPTDLAREDPNVGRRIGVWRLTRLLGRGGMGEVYEARRADGSFEQQAAIKLLQQEAGAQLERFQSERQILARLEHPWIARLYDGGVTADGRPYMVMEYVEGRAITEYCAAQRCDLKQRLALFQQVCEAVSYAHRNLVVHRDLKPSNILVSADGQVKLLDFGIATLLDEQRARLTQSMVPMTPICAAPEQLTGGAITTATDVYALGLLLFELTTGAHPWIAANTPVLQAMRTVLKRPAPAASEYAAAQSAQPVPPRLLRGDLDAIIAKALRAEPEHRYAAVAAFSEDLARNARGEPVQARAGARLYTVGRFLKRHRWSAAALGAVVLALAVGLGIAASQAKQARLQSELANRRATREEAVRYNLTRLFRSGITSAGSQTPTAKGMIDSSAQKVLTEYRDQPQLLGELVMALADLYGALEDVNGAGGLLEGFLAQSAAGADPAIVADARQKLANIESLRGHNERAAELLDQAAAYWHQVPDGHAEEYLEYLTVRVKLQRAQGDTLGAIATTRDAIAKRIALSGHDHRETAVLYNSLGLALGAGGQLDEALAANRETLAIYSAIGSSDSIDAQVVSANTGALEMRRGNLKDAEVLLKRATERERSLAGDSAAAAAALSYYGHLLALTNRPGPALTVLGESVAMATRYAGPDSPVATQARLYQGEAYLAAGNVAEGVPLLRQTRAAALARYGAGHPLALKTQIGVAEAAFATRDPTQASHELTEAIGALRRLGPAGESMLAQALELLGDARLSLGVPAEAERALREAVRLREREPADVWELAEARAHLGVALLKAGLPEGSALLRRAVADLDTQLGATHPQTLRARQALATAESTP